MTLLTIALQLDVLLPVVFVLGLIFTLIGVIYKNNKQELKEIRESTKESLDEVKKRQDKMESKMENTVLRIEEKIDKLCETLSHSSVETANLKSIFVLKDDCKMCRDTLSVVRK